MANRTNQILQEEIDVIENTLSNISRIANSTKLWLTEDDKQHLATSFTYIESVMYNLQDQIT